MPPIPESTAARSRRALLLAGLALLFALRVLFAFTLQVDSDEPQHLHVVWAWTQGLLPYRDVFDNHTPLFQLLMSPLLALLGEHADIVPLMRLAMIPFYALALWAGWRIGCALWLRRTAALATLLTALFPFYFVLSAQFRTDDLWSPLWVLTVLVGVSGTPGWRRMAASGLLAGLALAVSLKTTVLLIAGAVALALVLLVWRASGRRVAYPALARGAIAFVLAAALPLAAFAAFFAAEGAWAQTWYCTVQHNIVPGLGDWSGHPLAHLLRLSVFPVLLLLSAGVLWHTLRRSADAGRWRRRSVVLAGAVLYGGALISYWPLVPAQDLLPVTPMLMLGLVALPKTRRNVVAITAVTVVTLTYLIHSAHFRQALAVRISGAILIVLLLWALVIGLRHLLLKLRITPDTLPSWVLLFLLFDAGVIVALRPPWRDRAALQERHLAAVLRLTRPGDDVMDAKGESIFRTRPIYWAFENITQQRMKLGLIPDDVAAGLMRTGTPLVDDYRMPPGAQAFIEANYLAIGIGRLRVAGLLLDVPQAGVPMRFRVRLPQTYALVDAIGAATATLDGTALDAPRSLTAGVHVLTLPHAGRYALVWAPALRRGLTPTALFATSAEALDAPQKLMK